MRNGFTLTELLVVVIVLALLTTIGMHGHACLMRESRATACAANLNTLWRMHHNYMVFYGGCSKAMTPETGGDFWLILSRTGPPFVGPADRNLFSCPRRGVPRPSGTDYRGPAANVNCLADDDVVGGDDDFNHGPRGELNVLWKSGALERMRTSNPWWTRVTSQTRP